MIIYNMRNRGPYEYDKFTLNILQISNAVTLSQMHELESTAENKDALLKVQEDISKVYESLIGKENAIGLCEKIYLKSYSLKEEF